jgi:hypothetical protein
VTPKQEPTNNITQKGRDLLTLIHDAGGDGITRKALTDALKRRLDHADYAQLNSLEATGFITVEFLTIAGHPNVEFVYRETQYTDH